MEVYAIEIAMYGKEKNSNKVKEIYNKTLLIKSAIPHPRIMGVIRETGGKMHMGESECECLACNSSDFLTSSAPACPPTS